MNRIEGFGSLPYMGITGIHTIMNRVPDFKQIQPRLNECNGRNLLEGKLVSKKDILLWINI